MTKFVYTQNDWANLNRDRESNFIKFRVSRLLLKITRVWSVVFGIALLRYQFVEISTEGEFKNPV